MWFTHYGVINMSDSKLNFSELKPVSRKVLKNGYIELLWYLKPLITKYCPSRSFENHGHKNGGRYYRFLVREYFHHTALESYDYNGDILKDVKISFGQFPSIVLVLAR